MTQERYIPQDNQWITSEPFDKSAFAESVYEDVGQRFKMQVKSDGSVIIDPDTLPDGVSENDVKQAVRDNHPHR